MAGFTIRKRGGEFKKFNVKDGLGLKRLMEQGIAVAIVTSSSSPSTLHRAERLEIPHVFIGVEDKLTQVKRLCGELGVSLDSVAYMGDDLVDLPVMQAVGCPIAVADAMAENQAAAVYVTQRRGGEGAVREICDLLIN